mmetsp:Transcript_59903/g.160547  ORF Transcript_59903/g.160547 Transcript_59903/m.160547 type:complete len:181 (-) Transcript_59903:102-644(-)
MWGLRASAWVCAAAWAACLLPSVAERLRQPVVMHRKVPHSALLAAAAAAQAQQAAEEGSEASHWGMLAAATPTGATTQPDATKQLAEDQLKMLQRAQHDTDAVLHNADSERDLLQTQLLANGETLHVIKSLADTISRMKAEVENLENHEKLCRKRVADLKNSQLQHAEASRIADSVQVIR